MIGAVSTRQAGFTLIEILVTIVILSIGLLGIAGMQASSLRNNHAAYTKTQAANLAMDMADRIRANPGARAEYVGFDTGANVPADPGCIGTGCTAEQLADFDMRQWSIPILGTNGTTVTETTKPALPDGRGMIGIDNGRYVITLVWREPAFDPGMTRTQCIADQDPEFACFQMRFLP